MSRILSFASLLGVTMAVLLGMGCSSQHPDRAEENHPLVREAAVAMEARDVEKARDLLQRALRKNPDLARAHLNLALIYDDSLKDYLLAVYHYRQYLALRPHSEKRPLIEQAIESAAMSFAVSLPINPTLQRQLDDLRQENAMLRERLVQVAELLRQARASGGGSPSPAPASVVASPIMPAPPTPPAVRPIVPVAPPDPIEQPLSTPSPREYVVVAGDTLSRISQKVYGTPSRWEDIFNANKAALVRPDRVKVGQKLIVPP
jgi:tetratricopeptide (TPR) repeat protein